MAEDRTMQEIGKTIIIFGIILIGIGVLLTFINKIPFILSRPKTLPFGSTALTIPSNHPEGSRGIRGRMDNGRSSIPPRGTPDFSPGGSIGRLPGDVYIQKKNFTFYFPITTSILISIFLSLIFWLWSRR